jgi:hypothetical protein
MDSDPQPQNADDCYGSQGFAIPLSDFSSQPANAFGQYCIMFCEDYSVNNNTLDQEGGTPNQDSDDDQTGAPDGDGTEECEFYAKKRWQWNPHPTPGYTPDDPEDEPDSAQYYLTVKNNS